MRRNSAPVAGVEGRKMGMFARSSARLTFVPPLTDESRIRLRVNI
jgi:hypothetical protein